ncbi:MAG: hypothetical protein N2712_01175 [Brevinematales bacterium]|nr:hypothetical protein [Brevinematales bacterium]
MHIIAIIFSLIISINIYAFNNYNTVTLSSGFSDIRKYIQLEVGIEYNNILVNALFNLSDYGSFKNYYLVNPSYYIYEGENNLYDIITILDSGFKFNKISVLGRIEINGVSFQTQIIKLSCGLNTSFEITKNLKAGIDISKLNLFYPNLDLKCYLEFVSSEFLQKLCISMFKTQLSYPTIQIFSEIRIVDINYTKLNVGFGYNGVFGGYHLYPYITKIKIFIPLDITLGLEVRFSQNLFENKIFISYEPLDE